MRKFFLPLVFILLCAAADIYSAPRLTIMPGLQLWGDSTGFSGLALVEFDSLLSSVHDKNFFIEAGFGLSWVNLTAFNFMNYFVGGGFGYHWYPFAGVSFTPSLLVGTSFGHRYDNLGLQDLRVNFSVIPWVGVDFDIADGLKIGIAAAPHIFFNGEYSAVNWLTSLSFSISLASVPSKNNDAQSELAENIKLIAAHKNLAIGVDSSQNDKLTLNLPDISFEVKSDRIAGDTKYLLENVALEMSKYAGIYIYIEGHTDDTGKEADNQVLSENRAKNVAEVFLAAGFPKNNIYYTGFGESNPLVPNTSAENRAKNRCVIIQFIWDYKINP